MNRLTSNAVARCQCSDRRPATIRQYLKAGLIDEMHLAISPILLGRGEPLFEGLDLPALGYTVRECTLTEAAMHLVDARSRPPTR